MAQSTHEASKQNVVRLAHDADGARFLPEAIGAYRASPPQRITASHVNAYAKAVGAPAIEGTAPPLFVVVPAWQAAWEAVARFDKAAASVTHSEMGLHEAQDMTLKRAIRVGDVLSTRSAVIGMRASLLGTKAIVRTETSDEAGDVLAVQHSTTFFHGEHPRAELGELSPPVRFAPRAPVRAPDVVRGTEVTRDTALAYAAASNDRSPIHVDDNAARRAGLPGIIVHGMLLFALVCEHYLDVTGRTGRIEAASVRFASPAVPDSMVVTRLWFVSEREVAFHVTSGDDTCLMRRGRLWLGS